jgi:lysophospholipase L1-like esterase
MIRFLLALILCLVYSSSLAAQGEFYLKDGDTVVFYGDSITNQRLYTTFTEAFVVTRFPKLNIRFVHSGWSGDKVDGGVGGPIDVRLARDVLAYQPTVITIMLGMNDAGYRLFDPALFKSYSAGYEHIVKALKTAAPKARITAIQPSPYDDVTRAPMFEGGYNSVLTRYGAFVRELASREGLSYADLNASVVAALRRANEADPARAQELIPDRVHPSAPIHYLMAEALLKSWNAPAIVSDVEIDAASPAVRTAANTTISKLSNDQGIAWTQLDNSLPLPIETFPSEELLRFMFRMSDCMQALNREKVAVTGLTPGRAYALKIDGQAIGTHSAEEWAAGVELGEADTPMARQAVDVLQLIYRHNDVHWARWHMIQTSFETEHPPSMDKAMTALDTLDAEVAAMARATAQPKEHRYELVAEE